MESRDYVERNLSSQGTTAVEAGTPVPKSDRIAKEKKKHRNLSAWTGKDW